MGLQPINPPCFIAFLRAINVGGHTVKMERLRTLFGELGFSQVETFIASGNVIFAAPKADVQALEKQIENHLRQSLGYEVATFIRTPSELAAIAAYQPFPRAELDAAGHSQYIAFVSAPPTAAAQQKLMIFNSNINEFHVHDREIYWLCRTSMHKSTFSGALLEKTLGMAATLRNMTTVKKLAAKYLT